MPSACQHLSTHEPTLTANISRAVLADTSRHHPTLAADSRQTNRVKERIFIHCYLFVFKPSIAKYYILLDILCWLSVTLTDVGYQKREPTLTANKVGLQCQPVHSGPLQQQSNGKTAYIITGNSNIAQNYIIYETLDAPEWLKSMEVLQ